MRKLSRITLGVLMLMVGLPAAALAQSTQMQPQRPGVGPGQSMPAPTQRSGPELQRRPGEAPPPSQGAPAPSQSPQGSVRPEEHRHWAGGGWHASGPRYPYYPPYYGYNPYYPYDPYYYPYYGPPSGYRPPAVYVPGQWEWNGWGWVWQPGYWRY